jgi:hypothetical protein
MTDNIDPTSVPTELREAWAKRPDAQLAAYAGVKVQARHGAVRWRARDGEKVIAWRKRARWYVALGASTETVAEVTSKPGVPLETWGQLEDLVAGLVPRASELARVAS